jgi:hypothetical protein
MLFVRAEDGEHRFEKSWCHLSVRAQKEQVNSLADRSLGHQIAVFYQANISFRASPSQNTQSTLILRYYRRDQVVRYTVVGYTNIANRW